VVTREKNVGDRETVELARPRVVGVVEKAVLETVRADARRIADDSRDETRHGLDDGERGGLSAREDEVPDRKLLVEEAGLPRPLVDPFVPAADESDPRPRGELAREGSIEAAALRRQEDDVRRRRAGLAPERSDAAKSGGAAMTMPGPPP